MTGIAEQQSERERWADAKGDNWNAWYRQFESMLSPAGGAFLAHADIEAGECVVDVGCGDETTLAIARLVGEGGRPTGVDLDEPLLEQFTDDDNQVAMECKAWFVRAENDG